jgi:hypothetical protein
VIQAPPNAGFRYGHAALSILDLLLWIFFAELAGFENSAENQTKAKGTCSRGTIAVGSRR